jgi:hypothetical protein
MTVHNADTCQHHDCNGGQKYYDDPHYPQCDPVFGATCGDVDPVRGQYADKQAIIKSQQRDLAWWELRVNDLTADLASAREQIAQWKRLHDLETDNQTKVIASWQRECDQARAQIEQMREVVEAARRFDDALAEFGFEPAYVGDSYQPLHDALATLDQQAQPQTGA